MAEEGIVDEEGAHHRQQDSPPHAHPAPISSVHLPEDKTSNLVEKLEQCLFCAAFRFCIDINRVEICIKELGPCRPLSWFS